MTVRIYTWLLFFLPAWRPATAKPLRNYLLSIFFLVRVLVLYKHSAKMLQDVDVFRGHLVTYLCLAAGLVALTFVGTCIYNVTLHPLAKIPGSKLAAMTGLYEFWFDVVCDGTYLWEIERMHQIYGKSLTDQQ